MYKWVVGVIRHCNAWNDRSVHVLAVSNKFARRVNEERKVQVLSNTLCNCSSSKSCGWWCSQSCKDDIIRSHRSLYMCDRANNTITRTQ